MNRASLGGAVCADDGAAEIGSLLIALDAKVVIAALDGQREVPIDEFLQMDRSDAQLGEGIVKRPLNHG